MDNKSIVDALGQAALHVLEDSTTIPEEYRHQAAVLFITGFYTGMEFAIFREMTARRVYNIMASSRKNAGMNITDEEREKAFNSLLEMMNS